VANQKIDINPSTTVYELLDAYPELEDKLIAMAQPFKKLKNPLLRKSVAKVATLKHISVVGNIPLNELINMIEKEIGKPESTEEYDVENYFTKQPDWFSQDKVKVSLVEGESNDINQMTVVSVLQEAKDINKGEMIELITTFLPAPGIDVMKSKGYSVWTIKGDDNTIRTYFLKN
jgi:hypothetical protein